MLNTKMGDCKNLLTQQEQVSVTVVKMDDDIDIEEHDLLDNPAIKSIFPDLTAVKEEILDFIDGAPNVNGELDEQNNIRKTNASDDNYSETTPHVLSNSSKELLPNSGSKSPEVIVENKNLNRNKIILGSKPIHQHGFEFGSEKETRKIFSSKIELSDIGSSLQKSEEFCCTCQILFPNIESIHEHNVKHHNKNILKSGADKSSTKLSIKRTLNRITHNKRAIMKLKNIRYSNTKCFHCNKDFPSKKLLIEHIYTILKTNEKILTKTSIVNSAGRAIEISKPAAEIESNADCISKCHKVLEDLQTSVSIESVVSFYSCLYCSYYFSNAFSYFKHIQKKHRDTDTTRAHRTLFDGQCKYCFCISRNWKVYNVHLQQQHQEKINCTIKVNPKIVIPKLTAKINGTDKVAKCLTTGRSFDSDEQYSMDVSNSSEIKTDKRIFDKDSFILKSVLFNCKRCDIHFFTAKTTMNHEEHMELLVNWKCSICKTAKFFKKKDAFFHQLQHNQHHGEFTILKLDSSELERVLYKCSKCTIHFDEENYLTHYKNCEIEMAESAYCKSCDFLIHKSIAEFHLNDHHRKKLSPTDFTVIHSDFITWESDNPPETKNCVGNQTVNKINYYAPKKNIQNNVKCSYLDELLKLSYCENCKSYVIRKHFKLYIHRESKCGHLITHLCKYCGLNFNFREMATHQILHKRKKDLKLQDFTFYDIRNRKKIIPPLPQYPKCFDCDVHFISEIAIKYHICNKYEFLTCHICNTKISESIFKQHMSYHYYSKNFEVKNLHMQLLNEKSPVRRSSRRKVRTLLSRKLVKNKTSLDSRDRLPQNKNMEIKESSGKLAKLINIVSNNEPCNETNGSKEALNGDMNVVLKSDKQAKNDKKCTLGTFNSIQKTGTDYELFQILYCCAHCHTTLDTYDKVVEHCQDHLCGVQIETEICKICKVRYERKSNHSKVHDDNDRKKSFELLTFDTFYFSLDSNVWLKHVFGSCSRDKTQLILNKSIYGRNKIRMKIIQDGHPNLTVYKCNSCCIIIDPDTLDKHAETSCFKVRKHPCSFCGLPFLSYLAQQEHQTVHMTRNVNLKSYRIVLFNQNADKADNKVLTKPNKFFFLYQCRNCSGLVDKFKRPNHNCSASDLKKCEICYLMINYSDHKLHLKKHEDVPSFIQKNIKVILFGQTDSKVPYEPKNENTSNNFEGTFIDYTFYQCMECQVYLNKPSNHIVKCGGISKYQCPKCDIIIPSTKMVQHTKLHINDVDFSRANMNIIPFSDKEMQTNYIPADLPYSQDNTTLTISEIDQSEMNSNKHESTDVYDNAKLSEQRVKLYKCQCGLHFINYSSIQDHFDHCNPRTAKQDCWKCNLSFTPSVLFDHLIVHHGNKNVNCYFHIVKMSKNKTIKNKIGKDVARKNIMKKKNTQNNSIQKNESGKHKIKKTAQDTNEKPQDKCNDGVQGTNNNVQDSNEDELVQNANDELTLDTCENQTFSKDNLINNDECDKAGDSKVVLERAAKLLKCSCGLHFLDSSSIRDHFDYCSSMTTKQICKKCNLLFTPAVLFNHLLMHHGNKEHSYKFNIIEMSKDKCEIVTLYKCGTCDTHFIDYKNAKAHFEKCLEMDLDIKEKCNKCNLFFGLCSIKKHQCEHHEDNIADIYVVDIKTYLQSRDFNSGLNQNVQHEKVKNTTSHSLSGDGLYQIDLSRYDHHVYKCDKCNAHFLTVGACHRHDCYNQMMIPQDMCNICGLRFSLNSLTKHIQIHHKQMKLTITDIVILKINKNIS